MAIFKSYVSLPEGISSYIVISPSFRDHHWRPPNLPAMELSSEQQLLAHILHQLAILIRLAGQKRPKLVQSQDFNREIM